jgi:hypothetical protein
MSQNNGIVVISNSTPSAVKPQFHFLALIKRTALWFVSLDCNLCTDETVGYTRCSYDIIPAFLKTSRQLLTLTSRLNFSNHPCQLQ